MNKKNIFTIGIIVTAMIVSIYFLIEKKTSNQSSNNSASITPVSVSQSEWKTYTNIKYGYALQYPRSVYIQPKQEEERLPVEESFSIEMGVSGGVPLVGIVITAWKPYTYKPLDKVATEFNRITSLDLKSFSETLRQQEADDKNSNFPNKKVGVLEEVNFAGQKAYAVTITGYMDGHGSDTFRRIYLDGGSYKLILQFSLRGDLSTQIINTFKFSNSSTTVSTGN